MVNMLDQYVFAVVQQPASREIKDYNIASCVDHGAPYILCEWYSAFEAIGILNDTYTLILHIHPSARLTYVAPDIAQKLRGHAMYVDNKSVVVRNTRVPYSVDSYCFLPSDLIRIAPAEQLEVPTFRPTAFDQRDVTVVVARYNEDIAWLRPLAQDMLRVYNKGGALPSDWGAQQLPNVGREAHTYLHHIVEHYDSLSPFVVFTQGSILANEGCCTNPLQYLLDLIRSARVLGISANWRQWNSLYPTTHDMRERAPCDPCADGCFGAWFETHVSPFYVSNPKWFKGAVFCVRSDWIRSRPLAYYKAMRGALSHSVAPEEAYYLERAWYYVVRKARLYDCVVYARNDPAVLIARVERVHEVVDEFVVFESVFDSAGDRKQTSRIVEALREGGALHPYAHKIRHHVVEMRANDMIRQPSAMLRAGLQDPESDDLVLFSDATHALSPKWITMIAMAYCEDRCTSGVAAPISIPEKRVVVSSVARILSM